LEATPNSEAFEYGGYVRAEEIAFAARRQRKMLQRFLSQYQPGFVLVHADLLLVTRNI
jgi:hypothetical protein